MRQSSRGDLSFIQIRREIHIGRTDEARKFIRCHKSVFKRHMIRHPKPERELLKTLTIRLPFSLDQVRVRRPKNNVKGLWMTTNDLRQGTDRMLDAFSRT